MKTLKNINECIELMCKMNKNMKFEELFDNWHSCFSYYLKRRRVGYTQKTIDDLFYNFEMDNWNAMHIENTEYKGFSKRKLIDYFCGECHYICDRVSYDRIFRTHWLFRQAFRKEFDNIKF